MRSSSVSANGKNHFHLFHQHILLLHFPIPTVRKDLLPLQEHVPDHDHEHSHHDHRNKQSVCHGRPGNHDVHHVGQLVHHGGQLAHCHAHGYYHVYLYQGQKFLLEPANVHLTRVLPLRVRKVFCLFGCGENLLLL